MDMANKDCHFNFIRHILNGLEFFVTDVLRFNTGQQGFAGAYHIGNFFAHEPHDPGGDDTELFLRPIPGKRPSGTSRIHLKGGGGTEQIARPSARERVP